MKELEKLVSLNNYLKSYIQLKKKNEQIRIGIIGTQNKKSTVNLNYNSLKIEEFMSEIHCLCVELGFADIREDEYYIDEIINFGHTERKITKRKPNI